MKKAMPIVFLILCCAGTNTTMLPPLPTTTVNYATTTNLYTNRTSLLSSNHFHFFQTVTNHWTIIRFQQSTNLKVWKDDIDYLNYVTNITHFQIRWEDYQTNQQMFYRLLITK